MTDLLDRLLRLADQLPALGEDGAWLATGIIARCAGQAKTIDRALGLVKQGTPEATLEKIRRCHEILRDIARRYYPGADPRDAAPAIALARKNYELRCWPDDLKNGCVPPLYVATERAAWFMAFKAMDGKVPKTPQYLANIIKKPIAK